MKRVPDRQPHHHAAPSGFTLIEVLVVIVILGILAALVVPRVLERPDEARVIAARSDIAAILAALKLYRLDNQRYPTAEQGLAALTSRPTHASAAAQLEAQRLSRSAAQGSVGPALSVPQSRPARRNRRLQLRRRRPARRHGHRRRRRLVGALMARRGTRGFTLVEVLVVVVVIAIASGVVIANLDGDDRGRTEREAKRLAGALEHAAVARAMERRNAGRLRGRRRLPLLAPPRRRPLDRRSTTTPCSRRARCRRISR